MRIVLTGGGTGGHLFPLIAMVRALRQRFGPHTEFFFIGAKSPWISALAQEGVLIMPIPAGKLLRYRSPKAAWELVKIPLGFMLGVIALFRVMPDVVVGKGGYDMVPVIFAAWLFRIPIVLHESDAVPGLATRIAARVARAVALSFPESEKYFHVSRGATRKIIGNPVRETLLHGSVERAHARFGLTLHPVLLVLGGSQGAQEINFLIMETAPELLRGAEVILQCGKANLKDLEGMALQFRRVNPDLGGLLHIEGFLNEQEMADALRVASLVVGRAGSGTIFENALAGKPSILIPLTSSASGHQQANAYSLMNTGAARVILSENLTGHLFLKVVREMLVDAQGLRIMGERARNFARPNAARDFAELVGKSTSVPKF